MKLDGAAGRLSAAEKADSRSQTNVTVAKRHKAETELQLAKIAVRRAGQMMAPYLAIRKEIKHLDPAGFETGPLLEKTERKTKSP